MEILSREDTRMSEETVSTYASRVDMFQLKGYRNLKEKGGDMPPGRPCPMSRRRTANSGNTIA